MFPDALLKGSIKGAVHIGGDWTPAGKYVRNVEKSFFESTPARLLMRQLCLRQNDLLWDLDHTTFESLGVLTKKLPFRLDPSQQVLCSMNLTLETLSATRLFANRCQNRVWDAALWLATFHVCKPNRYAGKLSCKVMELHCPQQRMNDSALPFLTHVQVMLQGSIPIMQRQLENYVYIFQHLNVCGTAQLANIVDILTRTGIKVNMKINGHKSKVQSSTS